MSNTYYNLYLQKIFTFVKTIVVKSAVSADTINTDLIAAGYTVNLNDPASWKYYMNLAGLYHSNDTLMQITSLDTLETIDFNPSTLKTHRATRRAYAYGSLYYNALLAKYPTQETLILGCLNPVDINTAVAADDYTVLYYDTTLVESQESNLIPRLQTWINSVFERWYVADYGTTDNLYEAAQLSALYQQMLVAIINIRLSNCHTRFAHSYHIREYLASHGGLDIYFDALTIKQALWLYRNLNYIRKHAGKRETFEWLLEHIMTERGLPLASYMLKHNLAQQPTDLYPTIELARTQLNLAYSGTVVTTHDVDDVLTMEFPEAINNEAYFSEESTYTKASMRNSLSDNLPTKILESEIVDKTDAKPYDLGQLLLQHWLYYVATNRLTATVIVTNPSSGRDMVLSAKEAVMVWFYVLNRLNGVTLVTVPDFVVTRVRKPIPPTKAELRKLIPNGHFSDLVLNALTERMTVTPDVIVSADTFWDHVSSIRGDLLRQRKIVDSREHYLGRGLAEIAAEYHFQDVHCSINAGVNYSDWLGEQGFDIENMANTEYEELSKTIASVATGADQHTSITLKELQAAMLGIMEQLSSYSVQYIQTINDSGFKDLQFKSLRVGDISMLGRGHYQDPLVAGRLLYVGSKAHTAYKPELITEETDFKGRFKGHSSGELTIGLEYGLTDKSSMNFRIPMGGPRIMRFNQGALEVIKYSVITPATATLIESDATISTAGILQVVKAKPSVEFVAFTGTSGSNNYGYFTLDAQGNWIYYTNNAHNEFVLDQIYTDSVDVATTDGATSTITVNIIGTDDLSVVGSATVNVTSLGNPITASGKLTISDVDSPPAFTPLVNQLGSKGYGVFNLTNNGSWTWNSLDATRSLPTGDYTESTVVTSIDGVSGLITVVIHTVPNTVTLEAVNITLDENDL